MIWVVLTIICCFPSMRPTHNTYRKKRLLGLFVALATIGLIVGLIVAFKPEGASKAPSTGVSAWGV
jgi:hypothetical protein